MTLLAAPRAILFDWDNTLVDTWPVIHDALNATLHAMGHEPWSLAQVKGSVTHSMREAFPALFGTRWEEAGRIYQDAYVSAHLERLKPLPGSEETLRYLASKPGLFCGLVSNKKGPTLRKELVHLGWDEWVDVAIGAGDAERDKPSAAPLHLALKDAGILAGSDVWFVGDTIVDLQCAQAANATAILYGDLAHQGTHYQGVPLHAHVQDHDGLLQLLKQHLG
jgi:phosphoglycolate phosphatase